MVRVHDAVVAGPAVAAGAARLTGPTGSIGPASHATAGAGGSSTANLNRVGSAEVPVRVYEPGKRDLQGGKEPWGTLVWAHGGSFVRGTLDWPEADWVSRHFAKAGLRVYSVDYVLASDDVKAPALSNDVAAVLREVRARHTGPVFVGGASAGGHLATLAALAQADVAVTLGDPTLRPDALALVYPTLHRTQRNDPAIAALTTSLPVERSFGPERITEMYGFYLGEDQPSQTSPYVAGELPADRLAALPPTTIVNAEADDLRASAEQFAWQLREAGADVVEYLQPGTVHGYLNRPVESGQAASDARATIDLLVHGLLGAVYQRSPESSAVVGQNLHSYDRAKPWGKSLLLYPPVKYRKWPIGTGRVMLRVTVVTVLIVAGVFALNALITPEGTRIVDVPRSQFFITTFGMVIAGVAGWGVMARLYAEIRARRIRRDTQQSFVVNQLQQCEETYYELLALGGSVPRSGQFGYFTFGASPQGLDVRMGLGTEALDLPRERVIAVRTVPRVMVHTGGRDSGLTYDAIVFDIQCKEGVRQLSLIVGNPRWLGLRYLQGEALESVRQRIERALQLG